MALHHELGEKGEQMAADWLTQNGYQILHRNWTFGCYEIDIIATRGEFLHFVEVKARKYNPYSHPEDSVGKKKFKNLQQAADHYLYLNPGYDWIQYDILAITMHRDGKVEYFLVEDVFL